MIRILIVLIVVFSCESVVAQIAQQRQDITDTQGQRQDTTIAFVNKQKAPIARAFANAPRPTSDCMGSFAAGAQVARFGFSFSGTNQAQPCNDRENAQNAANLGMSDMARRMIIITMCADNRYNKMQECIELSQSTIAKTAEICDYPTKCNRLHK